MGNSPVNLNLNKKYDFIQTIEDPYFENAKIYRNK